MSCIDMSETKRQEQRLNYLLEEFKADSDRYKNIEVQENIREKQNLLRSIMNIRMRKECLRK